MLLIFWASSLTGSTVGRLMWVAIPDYVLHATAYAGLAVVWYVALRRFWRLEPTPATWIALAISLAYGVSDEFHQSFVPGRHPSWTDVLADVVGAGLGLAVLRLTVLRRWFGV